MELPSLTCCYPFKYRVWIHSECIRGIIAIYNATSLFVNSVDLPVLMDTKSDLNKDVSSPKMSKSSATVEVLIEHTIFELSLFIYFLVGSQGYTTFLLNLLIDQNLRFVIKQAQIGWALIMS